MQLILNGDARPVPFFLASAADHVTGLTGATPSVTISRNGAAFAAPSGAVAELGDGWYGLTPAGTDVTSDGVLLLHATAAGADPADVKCQVVAFSPYDPATLGLTGLAALTGTLAESYAANGQPATIAQLLYGIMAILANVSQSGATLTANRLDGETQAMTFTLDSPTAPTTRRRTA
jgi:hypothetical protein